MNHEEIKRYFENNPPPKEVRLTEWANITDTQVFLRSCYSTIRNFNGPTDRCPAWWHLRDFYFLMKKNTLREKVQEIPSSEIISESDLSYDTDPEEESVQE